MKTCKYCGCDISHLRANATTCGSRECINAYRRERKSKPKEPRTCEICGTSIDDLPGQRRICKNPECEAEQKRRKYAQALKEKICKNVEILSLALLNKPVVKTVENIKI